MCRDPVAYAHRQRYAALRAKAKQPTMRDGTFRGRLVICAVFECLIDDRSTNPTETAKQPGPRLAQRGSRRGLRRGSSGMFSEHRQLLDVFGDLATISRNQSSIDANIDIGTEIPRTAIDKRRCNTSGMERIS